MVMILLALVGRHLYYLENKEDYHDDNDEVEVEAGVRGKHLLVVVFQKLLFHPVIPVLLRYRALLKIHFDLLEQALCKIGPLFVLMGL